MKMYDIKMLIITEDDMEDKDCKLTIPKPATLDAIASADLVVYKEPSRRTMSVSGEMQTIETQDKIIKEPW